jgi:hypothetical protein
MLLRTIRSAGVNRRAPLKGQLEPQRDFSRYLVVGKAELLKIGLVSSGYIKKQLPYRAITRLPIFKPVKIRWSQ